jgi:hypothetical protein
MMSKPEAKEGQSQKFTVTRFLLRYVDVANTLTFLIIIAVLLYLDGTAKILMQ